MNTHRVINNEVWTLRVLFKMVLADPAQQSYRMNESIEELWSTTEGYSYLKEITKDIEFHRQFDIKSDMMNVAITGWVRDKDWMLFLLEQS